MLTYPWVLRYDQTICSTPYYSPPFPKDLPLRLVPYVGRSSRKNDGIIFTLKSIFRNIYANHPFPWSPPKNPSAPSSVGKQH
jgi:hypothetical protein